MFQLFKAIRASSSASMTWFRFNGYISVRLLSLAQTPQESIPILKLMMSQCKGFFAVFLFCYYIMLACVAV